MRMLRFTIRDVLWLTVVVAMAVAWQMERRQIAASLREMTWNLRSLIKLIEERGYVVSVHDRGIGIREANGGWSAGMSRDSD
jgi:hypothetical protein